MSMSVFRYTLLLLLASAPDLCVATAYQHATPPSFNESYYDNNYHQEEGYYESVQHKHHLYDEEGRTWSRREQGDSNDNEHDAFYATSNTYFAQTSQVGSPSTAHPEFDDGYLPAKAHPLFIWDNCIGDDSYSGAVPGLRINGTTTCDILVHGLDVEADLLHGGLDGVYTIVGCWHGKPMYMRRHSPKNEDRVLWHNEGYGHWQISLGDMPSDDQLAVYGNYGQLTPLDCDGWHLAVSFSERERKHLTSDDEDLFFKAPGVKLSCVEAAETCSKEPHGEICTKMD